jgi:hypothetical protein
MTKTIRIGGAGGFLGDSSIAAPQLIEGGNVDYLIFDYLAEVTMSILTKTKSKDPTAGYPRDFTDWVWKDNVRALADKGIKLVTNAGGVNPRACRARMEELAAAQGVSLKIAIVEGDDLMDRIPALAGTGVQEMYSGETFPEVSAVTSANVYLGGRPIADALALGADVVITGRVVDSALTLGILEHEFGWKDDDFDRLSAGSLAGHINECGAQCTGGLFTDWQDVPDWAHIGYPVLECHEDGSFIVSKPEGTGGLISVGTVGEQMLYEVGDPQAYLLPDVACDFSQVQMEQVGENLVRVSGAKGRNPTDTYKVCTTFLDGYRAVGVSPVLGMDAAAKAQRQADAIIERTEELLRDRNYGPWRATHVDTLGTETTYGGHARTANTREVVCKVTVEHEDRTALDVFNREFYSPMTSMSVGTTGWPSGRPTISPIIRLFSFPIDKNELNVQIDLAGDTKSVEVAKTGGFDLSQVDRPNLADDANLPSDTKYVRLVDLAWGRSGDKGDKFNVGIIARKPEYYPYIRRALTEERVMDWFRHEFERDRDANPDITPNPRVERFEVPGTHALNFLCHEALGGGGVATMRLDQLGKGKAQQLLEMYVEVPNGLV